MTPTRLFAAAGAAAFGLTACGESGAASAQPERAEIETIVREYILDNPEIIEEALIELQIRAMERERAAQVQAVAENASAIYEDPRTPVVGSPDADVRIVEFFDYKCGYCARTNEWVQQTMERHGDRVAFVMKEYPVLSAESRRAALAAVAVDRQAPDKYFAFHNALYEVSGPISDERIDAIARELGLDVERLRADMRSEDVTGYVADMRALGADLGVTGTPFFIINGDVVPGADIATLDRLLAEALDGGA
jgi:protein-disulfide isomerase